MSGTLKVGGKTLATHDTNTNVSTLTADEANVGSNALVVNSSGNVGIGTSAPASKLYVSSTTSDISAGAASRNPVASFSGGNTNNRLDVYVDNSGGTAHMGLAAYNLVGGATELGFYTGGSVTERMRIDSNGNVGIGTSSPDSKIHSVSTTAGANSVNFQNTNSGGYGVKFIGGGGASNLYIADFRDYSGSSKVKFDGAGNLLVGTTSQLFADKFNVTANGASQYSVFHNTNTTTAQQLSVVFARNGTTVGSINTTNTATAYATSSDYRLKEDWQPMSGSIDRLKNLNPVNFAWKEDGSRVDGFLAHEAQEVVPEAVTGTKDAVDDEGNPEYQGVDYGRITPLLTAALKEAIEKIEMLEGRIAVLEAK